MRRVDQVRGVDLGALRRTGRVLTIGTWALIAGVVAYSLMTSAPFVAEYSRWEGGGIVLALMVDMAFIMSLQADAVLSRHGVALGGWPRAFRWFTGTACAFLNTWHYVEAGDPIGVALHTIAPVLLLFVSEVAPIYRRAIAEIIAAHVAAAAAVDSPGALASTEPSTAPAVGPAERLDKEAARAVIEHGWAEGRSVRETAHVATRHPSWVGKVYAQLDAERGQRPASGAFALAKNGTT